MIHYYVFNATHSVFLTVGLKGSERGADDYISPNKDRPELMIFPEGRN